MGRNHLVDVFRGIDLLEMQATEICDSSFFDHAGYEEMKINYADTIFPCFSFISGMTIRPQKSIPLRKSMQLIGLGIAFNGIPLLVQGEELRIPGVLQRHGLSSIVLSNVVPLAFRDSIAYPFVITALWYAISVLYSDKPMDPFASPADTAQYRIDKSAFGNRTYNGKFDPEGLLGTLMTSVTVWSGYWFAQANLSLNQSILLGMICMGIGYLSSRLIPKYFPISKPLWTPSFTMVSSGWSMFKFGLLQMLSPFIPSYIMRSLKIFGSHSMEIYFVGELLMIGLKHPLQSGKSVWHYCLDKLNRGLTPRLSQATMTCLFEAILMGVAYGCNMCSIRIRI